MKKAKLYYYSVSVSKGFKPDEEFDDLKKAKAYARKMAGVYGRDCVSILGTFEFDF